MNGLFALQFRLAGAGALALLALQVESPSQSPFPRDSEWAPRLVLRIVDDATGEPAPARFTVTVDGARHEPRWVGPHGVRFASVHVSKRQSRIVTYSRGTGPVWVPLARGARQVRVDAARGLDYLPVSAEAAVEGESVQVTLRLRRWNALREQGWRAADAHLHYDRIDPGGDRDWLAMMAGDDIDLAQFMVLKGGMVPGVWARQFAYGKAGETSGNGRTIVPGEEYRDRLQGHLLLFGLRQVIEPIMSGVPGWPDNDPLFPDVLDRARGLGALTGAAHGGTLGARPTVLLDAILDKLDFIEIANWVTGFWPLDNWYRLLNCGYALPPTAGSDLPNNPQREPWEPFLGGMRMYARTGGASGSDTWNEAVKRGETFVTNGPSIEIDANGAGPGAAVCLPEGGGNVRIRIRMRAVHEPRGAELVRDGQVVATSAVVRRVGDVHAIDLETNLRFERSAWLAARGVGNAETIPGGAEVAHTAAVRVIVGGEPIWSARAADSLLAEIESQREYYAENGRYASASRRQRMTQMFERASASLLEGPKASHSGLAACEAP